jgi:glucose dehydrogenase
VKDPPGAPDSGIRFGGKVRNISEGSIESSGTLTAIDVNSGNIAWQYKSGFPMLGGVLATASNLVFAGEMDGNFNAFDAQSGRKLWHFNLGTGVCAPPVTYRVNGVQYVAVAAGGNGANGMQRLTASRGLVPFGDVVAIFALPDQE